MTGTADQVTITEAGYYAFLASFRWIQPGSAAGSRHIVLTKNGSFVTNAKFVGVVDATVDTFQHCHGSSYCAVGDVIKILAYNSDSSTRNGNANLDVFKVA